MALLGLRSRRSWPLSIFLHHRWRPIPISVSSDSLSVANAADLLQEDKARPLHTVTSFSQSQSDYEAPVLWVLLGKAHSIMSFWTETSRRAKRPYPNRTRLKSSLMNKACLQSSLTNRGLGLIGPLQVSSSAWTLPAVKQEEASPRSVALATSGFAYRQTGVAAMLIMPENSVSLMGVPKSVWVPKLGWVLEIDGVPNTCFWTWAQFGIRLMSSGSLGFQTAKEVMSLLLSGKPPNPSLKGKGKM